MKVWRSFRGLPTWGQVLIVVLVVGLVGAIGTATEDEEPTTTSSGADTPADEPATSDETTWSWTSPDGTEYEVVEDDDTAFTGDVPTPVSLMDGMVGNCSALTGERDFWQGQVDSDNSDEYRANAAAYVAYAEALISEAPAGSC